MRLGNNPLRNAKISPLAKIVVLVITHLPEMQSDYHKDRFEVVKHSLTTLTENINMEPEEYDLVVWDNGSCQELRDWLDGFVCKRFYTCNIGKTNAQKMVMRMLPEGTILAYGDDDIEYFPNWLAPQIGILETFPNVGMVTGWPVRITGTWGMDATRKWMDDNLNIFDPRLLEIGRFIPDEWERDYCDSVGRNYEEYKTTTWGVNDYRITYKGMQAYAMSQHAQFVCYPERVEPLRLWSDEAMEEEGSFDKAVDAAGLLRLSTVDRYCRHIGNVLDCNGNVI